jgi:L-alanine-DL-glutamate epimerase-like enolase superfamily enzyme
VPSGSEWSRLADLPLTIDGYALERLERDVSSSFRRVSTVVRLHGAGHEGVGEDVTYDTPDHDVAQQAGAVQPLAGEWTLEGFCDHLATLDLWPQPPAREPSYHYRVWAYESAALDLALRQAGRPLHEVLGREPQPVRFVVSLRLGSPDTPSSLAPLRARLDGYPSLQFKLDPTPDWDDELVAALRETGAVESVDFKGYYKGSVVDVPADPALYRRVLEALPQAWIEDPHDDPEIRELLRGAEDRVSYDAPIHSIEDIEALPIAPRMVNVKPSRLGGLRPLLAAYEHCEANGIGMYGGGQFELGPGRGQIQYLASLFHADAPNDVAPGGYNDPHPEPGLPDSPLPPAPSATGFRWEAAA